MNTTECKRNLDDAPTVHDSGTIRLGGAFRLPPVKDVAATTTDSGRIRLGGAFRLVRD